jgi:hypothetical protein
MALNNDELDRVWKEAVILRYQFVWRKTTRNPDRTASLWEKNPTI